MVEQSKYGKQNSEPSQFTKVWIQNTEQDVIHA